MPSRTNFKVRKLIYNLNQKIKENFPGTIQITNKSNLPLPIVLKIEGNFIIVGQDRDQRAKFEMNIKESRDIVLSFDRNVITGSNVAQSFSGRIKAYSFGKLQSTMNLQANIIYPTVQISCEELKILNNLLPCVFTFTIANNGPVESTFGLKFLDSAKIITKIQERRQENLLNIVQCMMKQKGNLKEMFFAPDSVELEADAMMHELNDQSSGHSIRDLHQLSEINVKEVKSMKSRKVGNTHQKTRDTENKGADMPDFKLFLQQNPDMEVTVADVQKYFKHLTKSLSEVLCNKEDKSEQTYMIKASPKIGENSAQDFLKLSHQSGTLKPGECRVVSIYFVGSSEGMNGTIIGRFYANFLFISFSPVNCFAMRCCGRYDVRHQNKFDELQPQLVGHENVLRID